MKLKPIWPRIFLLLGSISAIVILGNSIYRTAYSSDIPDELRGLLVKQPVDINAFELLDQHKQPFDRERLKGAWTFMFFGYTHCPDVCPTTLTELDNAASQLSSLQTDKRKIQYVFVSVDPARDTPELLGDYVSYFGAKFIAATGRNQELENLAKQLDIKFEVGTGLDNQPQVNHSSAMLLIDPQARYYARFHAPHYAEDIVYNFKNLLAYSEGK